METVKNGFPITKKDIVVLMIMTKIDTVRLWKN